MPGKRPRQRLIPPRPQDLDAGGSPDLEAADWAKGLHGKKRSLKWAVLGNCLLLFLLLGLPWARGYRRALATRQAYATFAACLYGGQPRAEPGLEPDVSEAGHLAAQLVAREQSWPARCNPLLAAVAPPSAVFLLPSVKEAEEHVRAAVELLERELPAVGHHRPLAGMPRRPLRAMEVLRSAIADQVARIAFMDAAVQTAVQLDPAHGLPSPARFPLYAALDATVSVWGDDQSLRATALDKTGVSYLEVEPGKPFRRARLSRPRHLRGLTRFGDTQALVWATPEARCLERASGCYGKTTGFALVDGPLLELPPARQLAAHIAGRVDRSLAFTDGHVVMAVETESRRVAIREFMLAGAAPDPKELPPLLPAKAWSADVDTAFVLQAAVGPLALATLSSGDQHRLLRLTNSESRELSSLSGPGSAWVTGCVSGELLTFVFGTQSSVQVGSLRRGADGAEHTSLWQSIALSVPRAIHASDRARDDVNVLCSDTGVMVFARDAQRRLWALGCDHESKTCEQRSVAQDIETFSVLGTSDGALVAYSGDVDRPQIRVRTLLREKFVLGEERVPAACWDSAQGMCGKAALSRLGRRIVLTAHEGADLVGLESADDGHTWSSPPVL